MGTSYQASLVAALAGNAQDMQKLLDNHHENPVVYQNLQYLFTVSAGQLLDHTQRLVEGGMKRFSATTEISLQFWSNRQRKHPRCPGTSTTRN
ncbi:hypothetical protein AAC03nite_09600 [Alicyclobacillus acidoterrestris]|nr:hypothetical protein AAC03nite_09600 [Alicyclobacillus acidoterrestris]